MAPEPVACEGSWRPVPHLEPGDGVVCDVCKRQVYMRPAPLDLASGIVRQSNLGGLWDSYAMRGFTGDPNFGSDYLVNGFSSSRGYNGVRDSASSDSVEVLKGPASALYGRGEPGGTVNIVTKKPRFVAGQSAQ